MEQYQDPHNIGEHYPTLKEHAKAFVDMEPHVDTLVRLAGESRRILELGVRSGVSTWALLTGLQHGGTLVSVDKDKRIRDNGWLPEPVVTDPRWFYIEEHDLSPFAIIDYPVRPDLVFIDTSHEYTHTYAELIIAAGLDAKRIALHDYALESVRIAVEDFLSMRPDYEIEEVEPSEWMLVVLKKR